jgi:hypothetical protein
MSYRPITSGIRYWSYLLGFAFGLCVCPYPSLADDKEPVSFSAFLDTTIAHDFNHLPTRYRPYTTQPYYTDEAALNLGFVDATLQTERVHGRIAAQYGSSVIANYAEEPDEFFRYIQEAYGGVNVTKDWQIDAGIFFSHIGQETWISRDNYTVSRSIIADYSPYYQTGIRSIHELSDKWHVELHVVRGWQNISDEREPCYGTQIAYKPTADTRIVYNTFIGNENGARFFNDVGINHSFTSKFGISSSFDVGTQARDNESNAWWYGWAIIPHYKVNDTVAVATRVEQYADPHQVILQSLSDRSFNATSLSANIDITILTDLIWRNEYRAYVSHRELFPRREGFSASDSFVMSSLIYSIR